MCAYVCVSSAWLTVNRRVRDAAQDANIFLSSNIVVVAVMSCGCSVGTRLVRSSTTQSPLNTIEADR